MIGCGWAQRVEHTHRAMLRVCWLISPVLCGVVLGHCLVGYSHSESDSLHWSVFQDLLLLLQFWFWIPPPMTRIRVCIFWIRKKLPSFVFGYRQILLTDRNIVLHVPCTMYHNTMLLFVLSHTKLNWNAQNPPWHGTPLVFELL